MRTLLLPSVAVALLFAAGRSAAADDARAIVARGVEAMGGLDLLSRKAAVQMKMKGTIHLPEAQANLGQVAFTGDLFTQPDGPAKFSLKVILPGVVGVGDVTITQVMDGKKGWRNTNGQVQDLTEAELAEARKSRHIDRVTALVALLKDKDAFTLTSLGESRVNDRPVRGVKVSAKGEQDVSLYFDKANGLLLKAEYQDKALGSDKRVKHEMIYSDYREASLTEADERLLRAAGLPADGPALVERLRKAGPAGHTAEQIKALIRQLGDDSFEQREKATAELVRVGAAAIPYLREAARSSDVEVRRRAVKCLERIGEQKEDRTAGAMVRLLAVRKPKGAVEALLEFLPRAGDEELAREVKAALAALAAAGGKPHPALVKALDDRDPARRAAAAAVLGKDGGAYLKQPGRRLYLPGLKLAMKAVIYAEGKKSMEREYSEVQFFNRFDDGVFARPAERRPRDRDQLPGASRLRRH